LLNQNLLNQNLLNQNLLNQNLLNQNLLNQNLPIAAKLPDCNKLGMYEYHGSAFMIHGHCYAERFEIKGDNRSSDRWQFGQLCSLGKCPTWLAG
jgi:hypothetical protein